jgi:hypothetical protein
MVVAAPPVVVEFLMEVLELMIDRLTLCES